MTEKSKKKAKNQELLPPLEAARALGVTYCTLNTWRIKKGCPCHFVENGLREVAQYDVQEVMAWKRQRRESMLSRRKNSV